MSKAEPIALVDLDGTLADFDTAMNAELARLAAPGEPPVTDENRDLPHIKARRRLIKSQSGFWSDLPVIEAGFMILDLLRKHGFALSILTKGPLHTTNAWTEKVEWAKTRVPDAAITICNDGEGSVIPGGGKSLVYGKVLFDDWPGYIKPWLEHRPRGFVIMLEHPWNVEFGHPNVFRVRRYPEHTLTTDLAYLDRKLEEIRRDTSGNG
jgi:5'-nucleotidase